MEFYYNNFFIVTFTRTKNVPENVPEIQRIIIVEMKKNSKITYDELAKIIGKNRKTILRHISVLKQKGILRRIGSPKGGHWEIIDKQ